MNTDQQIEQLGKEIDERIILTQKEIHSLQGKLGHALLQEYTGQPNNVTEIKANISRATELLSDLEAIKLVLPSYLERIASDRSSEVALITKNGLAQRKQKYKIMMDEFNKNHAIYAKDNELKQKADALYVLAVKAREGNKLRTYFGVMAKRGGKYACLARI